MGLNLSIFMLKTALAWFSVSSLLAQSRVMMAMIYTWLHDLWKSFSISIPIFYIYLFLVLFLFCFKERKVLVVWNHNIKNYWKTYVLDTLKALKLRKQFKNKSYKYWKYLCYYQTTSSLEKKPSILFKTKLVFACALELKVLIKRRNKHSTCVCVCAVLPYV